MNEIDAKAAARGEFSDVRHVRANVRAECGHMQRF